MRDYGVGLAPGESAMVFNRFWRADPARARTSGGTGLGLSIALEDTHLHGGWLQAWGRPGEGAQFRLTLPRRAGGVLRQSPLPLVPEDVAEPVAMRRRRRGSARRRGGPAWRRLLTGCVRMPDCGPVVETRSDGGVAPRPGSPTSTRGRPRQGDTRAEIVRGFLDAMTATPDPDQPARASS